MPHKRTPPSFKEHERLRKDIDAAAATLDETPLPESHSFARALVEACGGDRSQANRVGCVVLSALSDRISPEEARHLAAQLPEPYKSVVYKEQSEGVQKMDREIFVARIARDLGTDIAGAVGSLRLVYRLLESCIGGGEPVNVKEQLPKHIQELLRTSGSAAKP